VARELTVSQPLIRSLCESGAIEAELTPGRQWRIPSSEVERLRKDGLPALPRPLPDDPTVKSRRAHGRGGQPKLLAAPSSSVVESYEGVACKEALKREREVDWELLEIEDRFTQRQRAQEEEERKRQAQEARREEARLQAEIQAEAEQRRQQRDNDWLDYATRSTIFLDIEAAADVHDEVQAALDRVRLDVEDEIVRRVVNAAVKKASRPWQRKKDAEFAMQLARLCLPYGMTGYSWNPNEWEIRAKQAAAEAIDNLRDDASAEEIQAVAKSAMKRVVTEFEAQKEAKDDSERRRRVVQSATFPWGTTEEMKARLRQAIEAAMAELPVGSPRWSLERARDGAIQRFQLGIER